MTQPLANDPIDLLLGLDNDLVIDTDAAFALGVDGIAQLCRIAVQMFAGEWFLDLDVGVTYWDEILGLHPDQASLAAMVSFRKELLAVDGVLEILVLKTDVDVQARQLTVTWQVRTSSGNTEADTLSFSSRSA